MTLRRALIRGPRAALLSVSLLIAIALPAVRQASACSCGHKLPPQEARASAHAVFEGRAYGLTTIGPRSRYAFEVDRQWKGDLPERIEIETHAEAAACGRSFELGRPYVVYARLSEGRFTDTMCSRTRPTSGAAEDLEALGPGLPPVSTDHFGGEDSEPSTPTPTEPPRIEPQPPPASPGARGCSFRGERDATWPLLLVALAIWRRRSAAFVAACPPRRSPARVADHGHRHLHRAAPYQRDDPRL